MRTRKPKAICLICHERPMFGKRKSTCDTPDCEQRFAFYQEHKKVAKNRNQSLSTMPPPDDPMYMEPPVIAICVKDEPMPVMDDETILSAFSEWHTIIDNDQRWHRADMIACLVNEGAITVERAVHFNLVPPGVLAKFLEPHDNQVLETA